VSLHDSAAIYGDEILQKTYFGGVNTHFKPNAQSTKTFMLSKLHLFQPNFAQ